MPVRIISQQKLFSRSILSCSFIYLDKTKKDNAVQDKIIDWIQHWTFVHLGGAESQEHWGGAFNVKFAMFIHAIMYVCMKEKVCVCVCVWVCLHKLILIYTLGSYILIPYIRSEYPRGGYLQYERF